jgi:hypothetical protein
MYSFVTPAMSLGVPDSLGRPSCPDEPTAPVQLQDASRLLAPATT